MLQAHRPSVVASQRNSSTRAELTPRRSISLWLHASSPPSSYLYPPPYQQKRNEILRALAAQFKKICESHKMPVGTFEEVRPKSKERSVRSGSRGPGRTRFVADSQHLDFVHSILGTQSSVGETGTEEKSLVRVASLDAGRSSFYSRRVFC